ncbi:MAG TPA: response regulator transcription factor [Pyrinomonadaceae bacterium]|nr:response regulator transcription factor [Pyrinomonadaceae bacterium]
MDSVLIIDDDKELCELVGELLREEGFRIETASQSAKGLTRALSGEFNLVVLDVMMPGMNGFEVLRQIRAAQDKASRTPVLMLTARGEDVDRIVGLEIGADDYLPKPFNPRELVARINSILRRVRLDTVEAFAHPSEPLPERIAVGDVEILTGMRRVRRAGETMELTNVEYEVLILLLASAGRIVTREDLVKAVLGRNLSPLDRSIDMHISHLRKKLGHRIGEVERIKTVRGVGYIYARVAEA